MGPHGGDGLVGRQDALARVARAVAAARRGTGATLLISGAAGIGKTALLRAALAGARDVDFTWGTCVESGSAPGYWPWTQALNGLVRTIGVDRAREAAGADRDLLATLVPMIGSPQPEDESDRTRMLLLDATVAWLHALSAQRPIVVVLDDLQWVDESSLNLLELVVDDPRPAPMCVLGAFRSDEVARTLRDRLTKLVARADHVHLAGLDREATARLVEVVAPQPMSDEITDAIFRRAGGHPFFTRELALAAAEGLPEDQVPAAVRDAVDRRVRSLSQKTQEVLRVASLTGRWVLPEVVASVTGHSSLEVETGIAEAVAAGMVVADEDGRRRFAHDLFRETIAEGVERAGRGQMHLALGSALAARGDRGLHVAPSEVARHFVAAVGCGGLDQAVEWTLRAAAADRSALALAEAAAHLRRLRSAVSDAGLALADDQIVDVLLAEADVLASMGQRDEAQTLVRQARAAADRGGDTAHIARAALAAVALGASYATRRDEIVAQVESALEVVGTADPVLEARLTAALARELQHSVVSDRPRAGPLSERALQLGRASGDAQTLIDCLLARHDLLWTPGAAQERGEVAEEIIAVAERAGDDERRAQGLLLLANARLETGSPSFLPALESSLEILAGLNQLRQRYVIETRRAALALLRGDLDHAAELIEAAAGLGERIREPDTDNVRMSQLLELTRARGDADELVRFAAAAVSHWHGVPVHANAVAAGFLARAGDLGGARRHMSTVMELGAWQADRSYLWSVFVRELSVAAIALDEHDLCRELLEELTPLRGTCGVNGAVVAFAGSHAHTASLLARALGMEVDPLRRQAIDVYTRLGASGWLQEISAGAATIDTARRSLVRRGRTWDIVFDDERATVPHSKGMADLALLLARPDKDVHVLELYGSHDRSGPAGSLVDHEALASYRRRLQDLEEELAEATAHNDIARRDRAELEREALATELRKVAALGGRARSFANYPAERARKAVAARLRDAIRRLTTDAPRLAAHLESAVVTGMHCRYRCDPGRAWQVDMHATPVTPASKVVADQPRR